MHRKFLSIAIAALAIGALLVLPGSGAARGNTIKVGDDFFSPTSKTVSAGTTVKFNWVGTSNDHNVTKTSGPGKAFSSETTSSPGLNYQHKFKKPGTYKMICTIHPDSMKLKLKVN
jgi:plastocyanin